MNYFSYGSNMDVQRMEKRGITFSKRRAARLSGYRLEFNKVSKDNALKGFANIIADDNGLVEGALYDIDEASLPTLEKYEGHPEHYLKIPVKVQLPSEGQEVCAIAFTASPDKIRSGLKPSKKYLTHLLAGKDVLSKGYFEWLERTETLD